MRGALTGIAGLGLPSRRIILPVLRVSSSRARISILPPCSCRYRSSKPPRPLPFFHTLPLLSATVLTAHPSDPTSTIIPEDPSILAPLSEFLLAHPIHSFGITIILVTIVLRTTVTLPMVFWQRGRLAREKKFVEPEMDRLNTKLAEKLIPQFNKDKSHKAGYDEYVVELKRQLAIHQSALHKKYRTHPLITTVAPWIVNVPILIIFSLTIRGALDIPGNPMAMESFLWLNSLGKGNAALAVLGGGLGLMQTELMENRRKTVMGAAAAEHDEKTRAKEAERDARQMKLRMRLPGNSRLTAPSRTSPIRPGMSKAVSGAQQERSDLATSRKRALTVEFDIRDQLEEIRYRGWSAMEWSSFIHATLVLLLRGGSLGLITLGPWVPSGVVLYWVTSLLYGFAQNLIFMTVDRRKAKGLRELLPPGSLQPVPPR